MPSSYRNRAGKYTVSSCSGLRNPPDCPSPEPKPIDDQQRASAQSPREPAVPTRQTSSIVCAASAAGRLSGWRTKHCNPFSRPGSKRVGHRNRSGAGNPLQYPSPPSTGPCSPGACPLTQGNICGAGASPTGGKRGRMAGGVSGTAFPSSFVPGSPAAA